jgi:hypothetical protein
MPVAVRSVEPRNAKDAVKHSQRPAAATLAASENTPSGAGRAVFWLLAVAVCAGGTWWLWKPRSVEAPPAEPAAASELAPLAPPEVPTASVTGVESPAGNIDTNTRAAASTGVPQAPAPVAPPHSAAQVVSVTPPTQAATATIPAPGAVASGSSALPKGATGVRPKAKAEPSSDASEPMVGETKAPTPERTATPTPSEKPLAPAVTTPKTSATAAPAASSKPKLPAPASDSDNPY